MASRVFVDTWAWLALTDARDGAHANARAMLAQLDADHAHLVTTNAVLFETIGFLRRRVSHGVVMGFVDNVYLSHALRNAPTVIRIGSEEEDGAVAILRRYADKDFSFVDCLSFAVMQQLGITTAFTGDEHFSQMGFETIPQL